MLVYFMRSNYEILRDLKKKTRNEKDKKIRREIIYYIFRIGSYRARLEHPENFIRQKQIVGKISDAEYIAEKGEETLKLIKKYKKLETTLNKLKDEKSKLNDGVIPREEIYSFLVKLNGSENSRITAGKRLETILDKGKEIVEGMGDREIKNIFLNEAFGIVGALVYEIRKNNKQY